MKIIEEDSNDLGGHSYMLENNKGNLFVVVVKANHKWAKCERMLDESSPTARERLAIQRAVLAYEQEHNF